MRASAVEAVQVRRRIVLPPTVECVDDARAFAALRDEWNELLRASAADCPFLTWEWLDAWWTHLRESAALRLVTIRDGGELLAVAPLRLSRGSLPWSSTLEFLGTGYAGSDYMDAIVRRGSEAASLRAFARFLKSQKLALRFDRLPPSSLAAPLADYLAADGWTTSRAADGACPVILLRGHSWDSYLATLGAAHRANVRRRLRALEQHFDVRFERVGSEAARRAAVSALIAFHQQRWGTRGGSTAFLTPALRAFQDDATRRTLESGWLRLYVLYLDGALAAVMYGFSYNRRFYFYQHGFDEQFQRHSVGLALMALSIRAAIDEGAEEFDMLWGVEPYKWLWARDARPLQQIYVFPNHFGGTLHRGAVEAQRRLGRFARRALITGDHRGT